MNLIEQLGGYEAAKAGSEARHRSGIAPCELDRQLLEYRRQNKIYEVGDKVVFKDPSGTGAVYRVTMIHANSVSTLCPINRENGEDLIGLKFTAFPIEYRHTTDEENEAGKRLEVV